MRNIKQLLSFALCSGLIFGMSLNAAEIVGKTKPEKDHKASVGKPSAPITMSYQVMSQKANAGEAVEIAMQFKSTTASEISVSVLNTDRLTLLSANHWVTQMDRQAKNKSLPRLKVLPVEEGMYFIRLLASVEIDGKRQYKPFTIQLSVGGAKRQLAQTGRVVMDSQGEKLIVHQARKVNQ